MFPAKYFPLLMLLVNSSSCALNSNVPSLESLLPAKEPEGQILNKRCTNDQRAYNSVNGQAYNCGHANVALSGSTGYVPNFQGGRNVDSFSNAGRNNNGIFNNGYQNYGNGNRVAGYTGVNEVSTHYGGGLGANVRYSANNVIGTGDIDGTSGLHRYANSGSFGDSSSGMGPHSLGNSGMQTFNYFNGGNQHSGVQTISMRHNTVSSHGSFAASSCRGTQHCS